MEEEIHTICCPHISNLPCLNSLKDFLNSRFSEYLPITIICSILSCLLPSNLYTETILFYISVYDYIKAMSLQQNTLRQVFCWRLLNLLAAFDYIDHSVLLERLSSGFGISNDLLSWIKSYQLAVSSIRQHWKHIVFSFSTSLWCSLRIRSWTSTVHLIPHFSQYSDIKVICKLSTLCRWHLALCIILCYWLCLQYR